MGLFAVAGERGGGEPDPELAAAPAVGGTGRGAVLLAPFDQFELIIGEREEPDVLPAPEVARRGPPERLGGEVGVLDQLSEELRHLEVLHRRHELHGAELVPVELEGEFAEERVLRVGGHPFDDELFPRHTDADRGAGGEEGVDPVVEADEGSVEVRVARRVHLVLVQRDRELDQEGREVAGQDLLPRWGGRACRLPRRGGCGRVGHRGVSSGGRDIAFKVMRPPAPERGNVLDISIIHC